MTNKTILIVDDDERNRRIIQLHLEDLGYDLIFADSGSQALDSAYKLKPGLVLLDIMMDGIDGYEVTKRIKSEPQLSSVKVILISGKGDTPSKVDGYTAGADDYIAKPFNGDELKAKINVFLKLFNAELKLEQINANLEEEVQKRTQQLVEQEKLAFIGLHSAEIIHNLKNPLAIIKCQLAMLKNKDEIRNKRLTSIEAALERVIQIVGNVLANSSQAKQTQRVTIDEVIQKEVEFLNLDPKLASSLQLELSLDSQLVIEANPDHLRQVIGNFIMNSIEAMSDSQNQVIHISSRDSEGEVEFTVSDSGCGIAASEIGKIFKPAYSSKKTLKRDDGMTGTGLGLPFCASVIESLGGTVSIASSVNKGTSITVKIPSVPAVSSQSAA